MTITQVISTLPSAPDPFIDTPEVFSLKAAASVLAQKAMGPELNTWADQVNALTTGVATNAAEAAASASAAASSATAAIATTGASAWVTGTTYALNANAISQITFKTYRKKTASSVSAVDPASDATNWVDLTAAPLGKSFLDHDNSGTTAQVCDYAVAEVHQITVTGVFVLSITGLPAARSAEMRIDLVNGGSQTFTWGTTITWEKSDGTFTTNFSLSGYTLQTSGRNFIVLWNATGSGALYGKVI